MRSTDQASATMNAVLLNVKMPKRKIDLMNSNTLRSPHTSKSRRVEMS